MTVGWVLGFLALQGLTIVDGPKADAAGLAAEYKGGVCAISVFAKDADGEQVRAEFARRLRDGNLSLSLYGSFVQKFRSKDGNQNYPVTVAFESGATAPSRSGGYDVGGFSQSIWGGWGPGAASDAVYGQLSKTGSFTVKMDGNSYGPFTLTGKGAVHGALEACEAANS